jgi:hypothetical protein
MKCEVMPCDALHVVLEAALSLLHDLVKIPTAEQRNLPVQDRLELRFPNNVHRHASLRTAD